MFVEILSIFLESCADIQSKLARDQVLLGELKDLNSLLSKSSTDLKALMDSARCDLSAIEGGQISEEEAEKRFKELEVMIGF